MYDSKRILAVFRPDSYPYFAPMGRDAMKILHPYFALMGLFAGIFWVENFVQ
ncbi:MAG: hypothetical protein ACK4UP_14165 [Spirosomataceae bacterium]